VPTQPPDSRPDPAGQVRGAGGSVHVDSLTQILERAKELGISQAVSTASPITHAADKGRSRSAHPVRTAARNKPQEGEYLFGGVESSTRPFQITTPPFWAVPPTGSRETEVAQAQFLRTNHKGTEVFLRANLLRALNELSTALARAMLATSRVTSLNLATYLP
jgi:hypothetical protein